MKIIVNDKTFILEFRHNSGTGPARGVKDGVSEGVKGTTCTITPEGGEAFEGVAHLHPKDQFNRLKGRRYALQRALAFPGFSKDFRTKFWKAYFQATNFTSAL